MKNISMIVAFGLLFLGGCGSPSDFNSKHTIGGKGKESKLLRLSSKSIDRDADGTPDSVYLYKYHTNGNIKSKTVRNSGDFKNVADGIFKTTYNESGFILSDESDYDYDNKIDSADYYTYDANNNNIEHIFKYNEKISSQDKYTYDDNGNKLTHSKDTDGDGIFDQNHTYTNTYNLYGKLLTSSITESNTVYTKTITYHENGNKSTMVYRINGEDDLLDINSSNSDDAVNNFLNELMYVLNALSSPNKSEVYSYDDNGDIVIEKHDLGQDGIIETIWQYHDTASTYDYLYDNLIEHRYREEKELNGMKIVKKVSVFSFDSDSDRNLNSNYICIYDKNGYLITEENTINDHSYHYEYSYDEDNNVKERKEFNWDNKLTSIDKYTWTKI